MTILHLRYRWLCTIAAAILTLAPHELRADEPRTGHEPWYLLASAEDREQAQQLFGQAVEKHGLLKRGEAKDLYEQALALWDNPDIRWNLALLLVDLGEYLAAHEQLEGTVRWGLALGRGRLREVQDKMRLLESQNLAQIEALIDPPEADVRLDGKSWFQGAGPRSKLVTPGTHWGGATKPGYTTADASMDMAPGRRYRVTLRMVADQPIQTRRWVAWVPWSVLASGIAVAAVGAGLERQAFVHRDAAARRLELDCSAQQCSPPRSPDIDRARLDSRLAIGAFAAGGTVVVAGLVLTWLNQPSLRRPEVPRSTFEVLPTLSPGGAGISARTRF